MTKFRTDEVQIDLVPATREQEPILSNLLQLYMHDFSEMIPLHVDGDGRFHYPDLDLYWSESGRFPFLAAVDGTWAGFALVRQQTPAVGGEAHWDMAEFFVLRGYRRHGAGTRFAHLAFERFPGRLQIRVMESNSAACQFWQQAIESFTGESQLPARRLVNGAAWYVFRFES